MQERDAIPKNRRSTRQKSSILTCLKETQGGHITAEELAERLKRSGLAVGKATVYRYLSELEKSGKVKRYMGPENGPACYQYLADNSRCRSHYHLLCDSCGSVVHFDDPELENHFQRLNGTKIFQIDETKLVFYGTCEGCFSTDSGIGRVS